MLPQDFLARMKAQLGQEYEAFLASMERPRAVALRFNPLKVNTQKLPQLPFVGSQVPWEPTGYYYSTDARPGLHPYHEAGVYYLQEASAMAPVALLRPQPGERICDLCAAPGGKTTQIAGAMQGKGFLLSNEYSPKRGKILSSNVERMGIANALVTNETPQRLAQRLPGFFHRVLVDAPCSGEGMFRKEEAAVTDWSVETVRLCAQRQRDILDSAAKLVRPGGLLVYSTCTFSPEENEQTVAAFLEQHSEFSLEKAENPWFTEVTPGMYRMWPHKLLGEGHFAAVLRKAEGECPEYPELPGRKLPGEWVDFARELDIPLPEGKLVQFGSTLYWAPKELPDIGGMKVLRPGLELGEIKKNRFEPAHALALWLKECKNRVFLQSEGEEIRRYLHGEVLFREITGWCQVCVDGYGIGWGKGDGRMVKNHYPKGLRR